MPLHQPQNLKPENPNLGRRERERERARVKVDGGSDETTGTGSRAMYHVKGRGK